MRHPYESLESSTEWRVVSRAIRELTDNRDLAEMRPHEYIVGYLVNALHEASVAYRPPPSPTPEQHEEGRS